MLKGRDKVEVLCSVCGRSNKNLLFYYNTPYGKDLCIKHYKQLKRYGKILKRTRFDKNEYILHEEYVEIICYDRYQIETERFVIDIEDFEKCKKYKWFIFNNYPATSMTGVNKHTRLNRFLLDYDGENVVDHIDRNPLNNRRCNLRICTQENNIRNCKISKNNTSGVIGVSWSKRINKWQSQIMVNCVNHHQGHFENKKDAIISRLRAELKYFGEEFAPQRHMFEDYGITGGKNE